MNKEHLELIQQKAREIRSHAQYKKVWELYQADSMQMNIEENQSTWDLSLAPMIAGLMLTTGLSQYEIFNAIQAELSKPVAKI